MFPGQHSQSSCVCMSGQGWNTSEMSVPTCSLPRFAALRPGCPYLTLVASRWKRGGDSPARGGRRSGPGGGVTVVLGFSALALSQQLLNNSFSRLGESTAGWGEQTQVPSRHFTACLALQNLFQSTGFSLESIRSSLNAVFHRLSLQAKNKIKNICIFCCNMADYAQVTVYIQAQSPTPLYCIL